MTNKPDFENNLRDAAYLWHDRVQNALQDLTTPTVGSDLFRKYIGSFSINYQEYYDPKKTVQDMFILDQINEENPILYGHYTLHSYTLFFYFLFIDL